MNLTNTRPYFLGIDEVSGELNLDCDKSLKNEYIAHFASCFKAKTIRVWLKMDELFKVNKDDQLDFIPNGILKLHNYLSILKEHGVERFLLLDWGFVYPYGYKAQDHWVVPDPKNETDMYRRFLLIQEKVRFEIARNFLDIEYYEPTNEPDLGGTFLHRNGFVGAKDKDPFIYNRDEISEIVCDLSYYCNRGVKRANKDAKVLLASFCNYEYAPKYLEQIYLNIESGKFPRFSSKSKNVNDYFELLSFHPYNLKDVEINDYWLSTQYALYDVMKAHGDKDKKVWYTEAGWSDFNRLSEKELIGNRYIKLFETIYEKLPFVETVFPFRLFNLSNRVENEGEDNFGLIYNEFDFNSPLYPKDSAIKIYKFMNGEDADLSPLYKYSKINKKEIYPYHLEGNIDAKYRVLFFGNYITYQAKAPWVNWNRSCGLCASEIQNDYVHIVMDEIKKTYKDVSFIAVDAKNYEKDFHYKHFPNLKYFKEYNPDLVIIRLGENLGYCSLKDNPFDEDLTKLIKYFDNGKTRFILTNLFAGYDEVNDLFKKVSTNLNIPLVDISDIGDYFENISKEKLLNNEYIKIPNDKGMREIAKRIIEKL